MMALSSDTADKVSIAYLVAMSNGDDSITEALLPYVTIEGIMDHIRQLSNSSYSKSGLKVFLKESYTQEDIDHLFSGQAYNSIPAYRKMINTLPKELANLDDLTKSKMVLGMVREGINSNALKILDTVKDKSVCKSLFHEELIRISTNKNKSYSDSIFDIIGDNRNWSRSMFEVLDILNIDFPPSLLQYQNKHSIKWTKDAFDVIVNGVRKTLEKEGMGMPKVAVKSGRLLPVEGRDFIYALVNQYNALHSKGSHVEDFPSYIPCAHDPRFEIALLEIGAIKAHPVYVCPDSDLPLHGFTCDELDQDNVSMAMSLMPHGVVSDILAQNRDVMLVPLSAFEPGECTNDAVRKAVRYYRPTPITEMCRDRNRRDTIENDDHVIEAYLSGIVLTKSNYRDKLRVFLKNANLARHFVSHQEIEYFKDGLFIFNELGNIYSPSSRSFQFLQKGDDFNEEVERLRDEVNVMEAIFGVKPRYSIGGSLEFMEAVRESIPDIKFGELGPLNRSKNDIDRQKRYTDGTYLVHGAPFARRLARLGACEDNHHRSYGSTVSDQIRNILRLKSGHEREIAMGLLDQHDLVEVIESASTVKQLEFLAENYDIRSVLKDLDPKLKKKMAKIALVQNFGGSSLSL